MDFIAKIDVAVISFIFIRATVQAEEKELHA